MASSLDVLRAMTGGPNDAVRLASLRDQRLSETKRNLALAAADPRHFATGAIPFDAQDLESDIENDPYTGAAEHARIADIEKTNNDLSTFNRPDVTAQRNALQAAKVQLAAAPAEAQAKGAVAVENAKVAGERQLKEDQSNATQKLLQTLGGGNGNPGGMAGPGGSIKPTINASGGVSFTTTQMPALVQRAHAQLSEAHQQHVEALAEAERLWPGINAAAQEADRGTAPGLISSLGRFLGGVTGIGAQKYAGPSDTAALAAETARYRMRQPTPLSDFIQKSSFGNLEQMAGQLPGVRGLATVVPLFREHQTALTSNNPGAPLSNVQRLRHLINSEESALQEMLGQTQEQQ